MAPSTTVVRSVRPFGSSAHVGSDWRGVAEDPSLPPLRPTLVQDYILRGCEKIRVWALPPSAARPGAGASTLDDVTVVEARLTSSRARWGRRGGSDGPFLFAVPRPPAAPIAPSTAVVRSVRPFGSSAHGGPTGAVLREILPSHPD